MHTNNAQRLIYAIMRNSFVPVLVFQLYIYFLYIQITIEAIRGPGVYSDIAIDNAYLFEGSCNPVICDSHMDIAVNCTFDRTTCGYTITEGQSQWTLSGTGSYGLGLPADHTSGNGEKKQLARMRCKHECVAFMTLCTFCKVPRILTMMTRVYDYFY